MSWEVMTGRLPTRSVSTVAPSWAIGMLSRSDCTYLAVMVSARLPPSAAVVKFWPVAARRAASGTCTPLPERPSLRYSSAPIAAISASRPESVRPSTMSLSIRSRLNLRPAVLSSFASWRSASALAAASAASAASSSRISPLTLSMASRTACSPSALRRASFAALRSARISAIFLISESCVIG